MINSYPSIYSLGHAAVATLLHGPVLLEEKIDVWAVGPGLGTSRAGEILNLIERADQPMVIDADGLNVLAGKVDLLHKTHLRKAFSIFSVSSYVLFGGKCNRPCALVGWVIECCVHSLRCNA